MDIKIVYCSEYVKRICEEDACFLTLFVISEILHFKKEFSTHITAVHLDHNRTVWRYFPSMFHRYIWFLSSDNFVQWSYLSLVHRKDRGFEIFGYCFNIYDQLRSSQPALNFMYFCLETPGFRVVGMVCPQYCYLFLTEKYDCSEFKTTAVEMCLHTKLRNRSYKIFGLLLWNA